MAILLKNWRDEWEEVSLEKYEELMRKYVKHVRRNWYEVQGRVRVLSEKEVGIYSYDGFLVCILTCSADTMEKFKKVEGKIIKPIPAYTTYDLSGREIFIPHVK